MEEIAKKASKDSGLSAKVYAQEIRIKELETQLESKTHDAQNKERVIKM